MGRRRVLISPCGVWRVVVIDIGDDDIVRVWIYPANIVHVDNFSTLSVSVLPHRKEADSLIGLGFREDQRRLMAT
jgi:hypothetical protein